MIYVRVHNIEGFKEELRKRGWKRGRFNGKICMVKEKESWLWVCLILEEEVKFASFPVEESSRAHSEGVKKLLDEIKNLSKDFGLLLSAKVEYGV